MEITLQILVSLAAVMLTGLGLVSMFAPRKMLANFSIEPIGNLGINTIRSVIGGLFLASVSMLVFGLVTGFTQGFVAVAVLLGAVAIGRVVGILMDGYDKAVIPPLVVELVMVSILLVAHSQLGVTWYE